MTIVDPRHQQILDIYRGVGERNAPQPINLNISNRTRSFDPSVFSGGSTQNSNDLPWWQDAVNMLSASGKLVTNQTANWSDKNIDWKDIPLAESLTHGVQGQLDAWRDGGFGPLDLGVGFVSGIGRYGKDFDQTLINKGADPEGRLARWGGLAGDIILDPLNLVTFGGLSAVKAGAKAATKTAKQLAKEAGVKAGKNAVENVPEMIARQFTDNFTSKYASMEDIDQHLISDLAKTKYDEVLNKTKTTIDDARKSARSTAQNAIVNFDVPFTKVTKQFGTTKRPGFLTRKDVKIDRNGAIAARELLESTGLGASDQAKLLDERYGVKSVNDLNTQQFRDLQKLDGFKATPVEFESEVMAKTFIPNKPPEKAKDLAKWLEDNLPQYMPDARWSASEIRKAFGYGGMRSLADEITSVMSPIKQSSKSVTTKSTKSTLSDIQNALGKGKFVEDSGAKSALGRAISNKNPFNAHTFGNASELVNQGASKITRANTKIYGQLRQMERVLRPIQKMTKELNEDELKAVAYTLENEFPHLEKIASSEYARLSDLEKQTIKDRNKSEHLKGLNVDQINKVADALRPILKELGDKDLASGVIKDLREGYFPHVVDRSANEQYVDDLLSKISEDPEFEKYLGKSQTNQFGKERKTFQSFAHLDNFLKDLSTKMDNATDPSEIERLQDLYDKTSNLFIRDPLEATAQRYHKSIKSRAMKDLYDSFKKDGLVWEGKNAPAEIIANSNKKGEFERLDKEKAGLLGLKEGDYIHKEVLKGLERVDDLFTDSKLQKFLDQAESVTNIWKTLVTTAIPLHHIRNFIGNLANNAMVGVGVNSYTKSAELLNKMRSGTLSEVEQKVIQEAVDNGVLNQGFLSDFIKTAPEFGRQDVLGKIEKSFREANMQYNPLVKVGDVSDNFTRLALYIHGRKMTGSAEKAGDMVRKYLFNYNEMTTTDRFMKTMLIPFWNWTKRNIPLQIENLAKQPRYASTYMKIKNELQGDSEGNVPDYIHESYLKLPWTEDTYWNPGLPISDLNNISGSPVDVMRNFGGMFNPLIKAPAEIALNKQFFNNRPISYGNEGIQPEDFAKYVANQAGALGKPFDLLSGNEGPLDFLQKIFVGKPFTPN